MNAKTDRRPLAKLASQLSANKPNTLRVPITLDRADWMALAVIAEIEGKCAGEVLSEMLDLSEVIGDVLNEALEGKAVTR